MFDHSVAQIHGEMQNLYIFDHNLRLTMYLSLIIKFDHIFGFEHNISATINFDHIILFEFDHISDSSLTTYLSLPIFSVLECHRKIIILHGLT